MKKLVINVKREYFDQIRSGEKTEEYRLVTPYWCKRLEGKQYSGVEIRCGYPKRDDEERIIQKPYGGWRKQMIKHKHFGEKAAWVFAIDLNETPF